MTDPDTIRRNIEATRADLSGDVDALAEKVSPSSIADRQKERVKDRVRSARESVMGAATSVTEQLPDAGTADAAVDKAKGHPLVVGLIAFGAGWLLSSLLPTSEAERGLASTVKEKAAPLTDAAKDAASDAAQQLRSPAADAASHIKDTVGDAVSAVKEEGRAAASDVQDQAAAARDRLQDTSGTDGA